MTFITKTPELITLLLFVGFSIPIVIYDIKYMQIPNFPVFLGILTLFCYRFACTRNEIIFYLASGVFSVALFIIVRMATKGGLGFGDVKYSALCGIAGGPVVIFVGYFLAAIFAAFFYFIMKKTNHYTKKTKFAFGPFMALGTFFIMLVPLIKSL